MTPPCCSLKKAPASVLTSLLRTTSRKMGRARI